MREVLDRGVQKAESDLTGQPRVQADLLATLSHVYESLGPIARPRSSPKSRWLWPGGASQELETADALFALGRVDQRLGEFEESRRSFNRALELRLRFLGENHPQVGVVLNNLGALHGQLEEFDSALAAHRRALAIQRRATGPERIRVFNSLRGIGIVHDRKGEWAEALESFRDAQAVLEKMRGPDDPAIGGILNDCGRMLRRLKRLDEARDALERAMKIRKRALGPTHAEIAFDCAGLGRVLEDQGKLDEALALYQEGIRIRVAALGPENLRTGELIEREALLRLRRGRAEGRRLLERSLRIYLAAYGPDHSDTLECRKELAIALVQAGQFRRDAAPGRLGASHQTVQGEHRLEGSGVRSDAAPAGLSGSAAQAACADIVTFTAPLVFIFGRFNVMVAVWVLGAMPGVSSTGWSPSRSRPGPVSPCPLRSRPR